MSDLIGKETERGVSFGAVSVDDLDPSLLERVPLSFARKNLALPLRISDGTLEVALADHGGIFALHDLERLFAVPARAVMAPREVIVDAINSFYDRLSGSAQEVIEDMGDEGLDAIATAWEEPKDLLDLTDEAPVIRLLNSLLFQAVKDRASDIHIEPYEREVEVRFRVDGVLYEVLTPPKLIQEALVSRVKIMAGLDIAEKRLPQDGRIGILVAGREIDVRVSVVPTTHGERVVMRLLDRRGEAIGLEHVGLPPEGLDTLRSLIGRTSGIILVTGPTGSGKTTTLYAALRAINSMERNIITVEDPVEYHLKGVGQIQVNPKVGLTFAEGLRSILRQDPDVIMVGEIRDAETAEIATQASLTGHLVLSTLHTNDTASAVTRLIDMGIEKFLVASSLTAVLAQRLVRVLCPRCRESYEPDRAGTRWFAQPPPRLWRPVGCDECFNTGYRGRTGIFEMLVVDRGLRSVLLEHQDADTIKGYAVEHGMKTMFEDGLDKARRGVTSVEEVLRVTQDEQPL
ncbi:MAG TPA: type II secretion system protein GspE [Deltaproteobacteria bacterium]|nr:type II secretion system protein GspE [Deltaproteobacteria bacterium]